jgi:hypothetical protein
MSVSKLRPTDEFGLVVFVERREVVIPCTLKANLKVKEIFAMVDKIDTRSCTIL